MPLISALARNMATALQRLRQNHRGRQEVGLLYSLYSVTSCTQLSV
jgi:plasmid replication initiation protein